MLNKEAANNRTNAVRKRNRSTLVSYQLKRHRSCLKNGNYQNALVLSTFAKGNHI